MTKKLALEKILLTKNRFNDSHLNKVLDKIAFRIIQQKEFVHEDVLNIIDEHYLHGRYILICTALDYLKDQIKYYKDITSKHYEW